ncbi:MAG TPA: phosphoribosyltransferase family protein, partial [Nitrospirota bacterium]|nr:phosphoribosyltransferase family protein [Nitrospirota bacterium]
MKELETGEVIITQGDLQKRIAELGKSISEDYRGRDPVLICVLKGAVVFMADLIRTIPIPIVIDFLSISSYDAGRGESGAVRIIKDLDINIAKREVLVIEDIIDTGFTLGYLLRIL